MCGKKKEFCHVYFLKSHPEKLKFIKRRVSERRKRARASTTMPSDASAGCMESKCVTSQIAMVRLDIQHLREELDALKQQLFCMDNIRNDEVKHRTSKDLVERMEAKTSQTVGRTFSFFS